MKYREVINITNKNRNAIIASNIKSLIERDNITQKKLANSINISPSTLSDYMNLRSNPSHGVIQKIADYFNVQKSDIDSTYKEQQPSTTLTKIIETLTKLEEARQKNVLSYAEQQLEEQESLNSKVIPMVGKTAANPSVLEYGDVDIEQQSFSHVPEGADCAIYIQGDSMEPLIKDGSIVFYKRQEDVETGEIAVVEINGDGATCKRVIKDYDNKQIILSSVNDRYEDRILHDEEVRIIGKVILQ